MPDSAVVVFLAHNVCFGETDPLNSRAYMVSTKWRPRTSEKRNRAAPRERRAGVARRRQTANHSTTKGSNAFVAKLDLTASLPAPSITTGRIVPIGSIPTSLGGASVMIDGKPAYLLRKPCPAQRASAG